MEKEDIIELLFITLGIVVLTRIFYPCIQNLFSITDRYSAATLTSSLIMAIVTAVYVRYTYRIFDATNKNTEQTAKAQKIAYLERRLELFYLPLKTALRKVNPAIIELEIENISKNSKEKNYSKELTNYIQGLQNDFAKDSDRFLPCSYLAYKETNDSLTRFTDVFLSLYLNEHIIDDLNDYQIGATIAGKKSWNFFYSNRDLRLVVDKDIESIKNDLTKLVNI